MKLTTLLLPFLFAPAALSLGTAIVRNNCPFSAYLWSTSPTSRPYGPWGLSNFLETYEGANRVLKIALTNETSVLYDGKTPLMQFQYTVDGDDVWYSLADQNGDPFAGWRVVLYDPEGQCEHVVWDKGMGESKVLRCGKDKNLVLSLCDTRNNKKKEGEGDVKTGPSPRVWDDREH